MKSTYGRALVVEDDAVWQQILGEILSDSGLVVATAADLESALGRLRAQAYRLAVIDLSLGGGDHHNQDGLTVLDAVRRLNPSCVAILLTGFATVELAVSAITEHGSYTCLRKETFHRAEFRRIIGQALATPPAASPEDKHRSPISQTAASSGVTLPAADKKKRTALIVEDDAGWRSILSELLEEAGLGVRSCSSYGEALGLMRRKRFALLTVDLVLASSASPQRNDDGYRVLAQARAAACPAIVVTGTASAGDIERLHDEYGAFAYLEKHAFDRVSFRRSVTEALAGQAATAGDRAALTSREREVLAMLAQGLTNKEIASAMVISPNTVKRHLKAVFAKLGVKTRVAAAARASL